MIVENLLLLMFVSALIFGSLWVVIEAGTMLDNLIDGR
jgi:hypothetical protein